MADLYSTLQTYKKSQDTRFPTSGTIYRIDGGYIDVLVRSSNTILRHVKCVGAPTTTGQAVVLTWENSTPIAHMTDGSTPSTTISLIRGPEGPAGPQGPTGQQGPTGSVSAAYSVGFTELANAPATPAAGTLALYAKTDHKVYKRDSAGVEAELALQADVQAHEVYGTSYLSAPYDITAANAVYVDTGLSITLPSAGTYEIFGNIRGRMQGATGTSWWITCKLYNATASADVANSERLVILTGTANMLLQATCPINAVVTVSGATTIKLYAYRVGGGGATFTISGLFTDTNGRTMLGYKKIAKS